MSKRFTATNALLIGFTRDRRKGVATVKFSLNSEVRDALEWPDLPLHTGEWSPEQNELVVSMVEFTPNDKELKQNSVSIDATEIRDFTVVRKKKKEGKNAVKADKFITEVKCKIVFGGEDDCEKLGRYIVGAARSKMLVCYTPQPHQEDLPGTKVDMSPDDAQMPLQTPERAAAVDEIPTGPAEAPTHAQKLAERRAETERKAVMRKTAGTVQ